jgi:hypothetical protein
MSLKKGNTRDAVSGNVEKLVHEWERDGTIGKSHPKTKKNAVKQAVAISLKKAGKSRTQQKSAGK